MNRLSRPASRRGTGALDEPLRAGARVHRRVATAEGDADLHSVQPRATMPAWPIPVPTTPDLAALADRRASRCASSTSSPRPSARRRPAAASTTSRSICADPERTIRFYQDLVGFPLVELFENRDYPGSSHFFFDIGNRNMLAFFDFPGLGLEPVPEGLGGVQHVAISVTPEVFEAAKVRLDGRRRRVPRSRHGRRGVDLLQGPRQHPGRAHPPAAVRDAGERAARQLAALGLFELRDELRITGRHRNDHSSALDEHVVRELTAWRDDVSSRSSGSPNTSCIAPCLSLRGRFVSGSNQRCVICHGVVTSR